MRLGVKIAIRIVMLIVMIVGGIMITVIYGTGNLINSLTGEQASAANIALVHTIEDFSADALERAESLSVFDDIVKELKAGGDPVKLRNILASQEGRMDYITLSDKDGVVLARSYSDKLGDSIAKQKVVASVMNTGKGISAIETGTQIPLAVRASAPILNENGELIAIISCGYDLSNPAHVEKIKAQSNCEVTIFAGDTRLSTTLINENGERAIGTKASDTIIETVLQNQQNYTGRANLFGAQYEVFYSPLIINGESAGILFSGINIENTLAYEQYMIKLIVIVAISISLFGMIMVFETAWRLLSRPLKRISAFANQMEHGEIGVLSDTNMKINVRSKDEIGILARTLEKTCGALRGYVGEISDRMQDLANGDLTTESTYPFKGDFVVIQNSINKISNSLSATMSEINTSATQVSMGSRQIADGAQTLAQGATEQSATVEKLSHTIANLSEKISSNAENSSKAKESNSIAGNHLAESLESMEKTLASMHGINESSTKIANIIKVIDEIAFQTNILALNAAVEAARAGQHGKGFAVVAEEVRNLANKSAAAAKESSGFIDESVRNVAEGMQMVEQTNNILKTVVKYATNSMELVEKVAAASDEQAHSIQEINRGMHEVSEVVQMNSSTAEASASASEQMSGQSAMLEELISQFKINDKKGYTALPGKF